MKNEGMKKKQHNSFNRNIYRANTPAISNKCPWKLNSIPSFLELSVRNYSRHDICISLVLTTEIAYDCKLRQTTQFSRPKFPPRRSRGPLSFTTNWQFPFLVLFEHKSFSMSECHSITNFYLFGKILRIYSNRSDFSSGSVFVNSVCPPQSLNSFSQ